MLLHNAHREARTGPAGELVLLAEQDRRQWSQTEIDEGCSLVEGALQRGRPGPYALEAAIAAVHAEAASAEQTDWQQIKGLYERLLALYPSPVVALNHAVAVSMADGPGAALPLVDTLSGSLADYHLWHATRADLLRRLGRSNEAVESYERAATLTQNQPELDFIAKRIRELTF